MKKRNFSEEEENKICKEYLEGKTIKQLYEEYDSSNRKITKILKNYNIEIRRACKKLYKSWDEAFKNYTQESCYWGGMIASDGCVFSKLKNGTLNAVTITLKEEDKDHLEKLKKYLKYEGGLYYNKKTKAYTLTVVNEKMVYYLCNNFNITKNKSLTYTPPKDIPNELKSCFILGMFDGDGSISYSNSVWWDKDENGRFYKKKIYKDKYTFYMSFTGTLETINYIKDFYCLSLSVQKRNKDNKNNFSLQINGNIQIYSLLKRLYKKDSLEFCLHRKYEKFKYLENQIV